MALRGFDDYEVTLGDEMRGHRATLGASLPELERALRIRSGTILAIENGDLQAFPNQGSIPGLVRVYARHIGMDPQEAFRRFCEETGFSSPNALTTVGEVATRSGRRIARNSGVGAILAESRFAASPARASVGPVLRAAFRTVVIAVTVGGAGYFGHSALGSLQQVGKAPLPLDGFGVMSVMAATPAAPARPEWTPRPDVSVYAEGGALSTRTARAPSAPALPLRDGPIAAIDPHTGLVAAQVQRSARDAPDAPHARGPLEDRTERAMR